MMRKAIIISLIWAILVTDGMVNCAVNINSLFRDIRHGSNHHTKANASHPQFVNMKRSDISQLSFYSNKTSHFYVNGSTIPQVDWDAGPSYAGLIDVDVDGKDSNLGQLFFWFWPTTHPNPDKSILIWLTGGPGCSSLLGFLEEHGPIQWQPGTYKPIRNLWSWHRLTNVVYIDQPVGTGFSSWGKAKPSNEWDVSRDFMGFWKNFVDVFDLQGYKVYLAGESYAGMYCPYIGTSFLSQNDTQYFNLSGMLIYDGLIGDGTVQSVASAAYHVDYWSNSIPLNKTTVDFIHNVSSYCGYNDYVDRYLTFPPPGPQPTFPPGDIDSDCAGGNLLDEVLDAIRLVNPGFDIYQISQLLPVPDDPLNVFYYDDREPYFNLTDVKKAINAPDKEWRGCQVEEVFAGNFDDSGPPFLGPLPNVIDRTQNVIISHGINDFIFLANGTLLTIQNMTWGGQLGFQTQPNYPLFVPYQGGGPTAIPPDPNYPDTTFMRPPSGVMGTTHTERGLTWNLVMNAGHMTPMFQPALAYRQIEVLLGRVSNMSCTDPFVISANGSTLGGPPQPRPDELGGPVGPILGRPAVESPGGYP